MASPSAAPLLSVRKNLLYSAFYTLINIGFPILSFAYISRVMGPEILGRLNFAVAFASFFVLAASLAMPLYGAREIAKARDDRARVDRVFTELFHFNLMTTAFAAAVFASLFLVSSRMREDWKLFLVTGSAILFNALTVDWLFQGLENYKFIAWRNLLFKLVSIGLLFGLVRRKEDFLWTAGISVFSNAGSSLLGLLASRRFVTLSRIPFNRLLSHWKPMATLSASTLAATMYVFLDSVLLGYLAGNRAVGIFTAATRAVKVTVSLLQALSSVMIPRISYYVERGLTDEYRAMARKSLSFIYFLSFPVAGGLFVLAPRIIGLLSGAGYSEAVTAMRISVPIVILMGFTNFLGLQVIFPNRGERKLLAATLIGAAVDLALNLILIPRYGQNGTAIALVSAETCSVLALIAMSRKIGLGLNIFGTDAARYAAAGALASCLMYAISHVAWPNAAALAASLAAGAVFYLGTLRLMRDPLLLEAQAMLEENLKRISAGRA